jgi:hypothetical protein
VRLDEYLLGQRCASTLTDRLFIIRIKHHDKAMGGIGVTEYRQLVEGSYSA